MWLTDDRGGCSDWPPQIRSREGGESVMTAPSLLLCSHHFLLGVGAHFPFNGWDGWFHFKSYHSKSNKKRIKSAANRSLEQVLSMHPRPAVALKTHQWAASLTDMFIYCDEHEHWADFASVLHVLSHSPQQQMCLNPQLKIVSNIYANTPVCWKLQHRKWHYIWPVFCLVFFLSFGSSEGRFGPGLTATAWITMKLGSDSCQPSGRRVITLVIHCLLTYCQNHNTLAYDSATAKLARHAVECIPPPRSSSPLWFSKYQNVTQSVPVEN